jgi:two-component system response regulator YesN
VDKSMLYDLVIVDDEEIIRKGLAGTVDWAALGFKVAATLPNGEAALDYLAEHGADAVLADIRMPRVSGLDLAKRLKLAGSGTKVVLLSGFDTFRYAQEAIDYGVFSYLLKPSKQADIEEVFQRLRRVLDEDRRVGREREELRRDSFSFSLARWFRGEIDAVAADLSAVPEWAYGSDLGMAIVEALPPLRGWVPDRSGAPGVSSALLDAAAAALPGRSVAVATRELEVALVFGSDATAAAVEKLAAAAASVRDAFPRWSWTAVLCPGSAPLDDLRREYLEACSLRFGRWSAGAETVLVPKPRVSRPAAQRPQAAAEVAEALRGALCDPDPATGELVRVLEGCGGYRELSAAFRSAYARLARGSAAAVFEPLEAAAEELAEELETVATGERFSAAVSALRAVMADRSEMPGEGPKRSIALAQSIIAERYAEDLSLDALASELGLSPAYFCRLFKKETGVNFKDYLTELRLDLAKEALQDPRRKVYEVAEAVGFRDQRYFSELFKKRTGYSPLEYRDHC